MTSLENPAPVNPRLVEIAAKLDAAHRHAREVEAAQRAADDIDAAERACEVAYAEIYKLEDELANLAATTLGQMQLKAKYASLTGVYEAVTASIVRDLRALDPPRPSHIRP